MSWLCKVACQCCHDNMRQQHSDVVNLNVVVDAWCVPVSWLMGLTALLRSIAADRLHLQSHCIVCSQCSYVSLTLHQFVLQVAGRRLKLASEMAASSYTVSIRAIRRVKLSVVLIRLSNLRHRLSLVAGSFHVWHSDEESSCHCSCSKFVPHGPANVWHCSCDRQHETEQRRETMLRLQRLRVAET